MDDYNPPLVTCRICRTNLDVHSYSDGRATEYRHADAIIREFKDMVTDHEPDPVFGLTEADTHGVCDFCSEPSTRWTYPCESFVATDTPTMGIGMVQSWAACDPCHTLIEAGDWRRLSKRSMDHIYTWTPPGTRKILEELHQQFVRHRTGPAIDNYAAQR